VRGIAWQPWCVYFCFVLLLIFRCVHSAVTPGESRFRPHCNGALVMGINAKLRCDINSSDFSTCLLLIQLVWVAVDISSYHSLNRVDIKSHNLVPQSLVSVTVVTVVLTTVAV